MRRVDTTRDDRYMKIAEKYIAESRMSDVRLLVTDADTGLPIPWSNVEYVQTSHDFVFTSDTGTYSDKKKKKKGDCPESFS
jgi:hypothetical protein